ncbi:LysR family transcriptional regulator [uncultured Pseudomonas sp.]|uniref:LysR family transcriptional regulator n=1 Tax=uncultured Pseudomonas sp. TaxID=114707 RepID=UPI00262B3C5E|nr:LysR family transcriptional regulator [uncultured Pseudomonas sp.]MDX1298310.1 LysR family transcriptional regulator [Pseudomonas sp.]
MNIELRHLRHALALAEHGNFARAAEALHLSQPALSRSLQALEAQVGEQLFDRSHREVTPTAMGELLLQHARKLLLHAQDLKHDLQLARGLQQGELRIGVGPFAGAALVAPVLAILSRAHPGVYLEVILAPWQELPARLQRREIDLMVVDLHEIEDDPSYVVQLLGEHHTLPVCRAGHPLLEQASPSTEALLRYPLAGPNLPEAIREELLKRLPSALQNTWRAQWKLAITCDSSAMLKQLLLGCEALALLPWFMVEDELQRGDLQALPSLAPGLSGRFGVARLHGRRLSLAAQCFIEALLAHDVAVRQRQAAWLAR